MLRYKKPDEYKAMQCYEVKIADATQGIVEHIITVFGIIDRGDDMSHPGCFLKTLEERGDRVKVLDAHQNQSLRDIVAIPLEVKEIGRGELPSEVKSEFPEASGGLWAKTQFMLETPQGLNAFNLIKAGAVNEFSFGFDVIKSTMEKKKVNGKMVSIRNLIELRLWEYSPVLWGKNQGTTVIDVKTEGEGDDPPCDQDGVLELLWVVARKDKVSFESPDLEDWYLPDEMKSIWTRSYVEDLPDSAFLFLEGEGDDVKRHLPVRNADGEIDLPHVRNAIQHALEIDSIPAAQAVQLQAKAQRILAEHAQREVERPSEEKPVDVTAKKIRIRVRAPGSCTKGTFRTITVGSASKGIKAVICRPKGKTTTVIQSYLFDKSKWTTTRARAWVKKNSTKSVNLTKLLVDVREAFMETFSGSGLYGYWISEVFDDFLIAYEYSRFGGRKYYKVSYTFKDDEIEFAATDKWVQGEYVFKELKKVKDDAPDDKAALNGAGDAATRAARVRLKEIEWEMQNVSGQAAA